MNSMSSIEKKLVKKAQDLDVFKLAFESSLEIHKDSLSFPKHEQYALANQIRKSSKSICANLVEGFAKQPHSRAEFARFISMSIGSSNETELWISYCAHLGYIDKSVHDKWVKNYISISKMLQKLRMKVLNQSSNHPINQSSTHG